MLVFSQIVKFFSPEYIARPEVEKSDFSWSLKPPEMQISRKYIGFFIFKQKKAISLLVLVYVLLNNTSGKTKVDIENYVFFQLHSIKN